MVCLKYTIVNILIKVIGGGGGDGGGGGGGGGGGDDDDDDDDDDNNTWNVKTKVVPVIGGVTGTISESCR